jgi:hypothetical protein
VGQKKATQEYHCVITQVKFDVGRLKSVREPRISENQELMPEFRIWSVANYSENGPFLQLEPDRFPWHPHCLKKARLDPFATARFSGEGRCRKDANN